MSVFGRLLGRRLATTEEAKELVGVPDGVSVFGLDALGSAAYGPEAALTVLIPAGIFGLRFILPISLMIVGLLLLVYFSYRQTIDAYPSGGGAYVVAGENLGKNAGVVAGAALMLDYLLNVCVGISTGIGALVSAIPRLQRFTLVLCLGVLALLVVTNLRGVRESGVLWRVPTFSFVMCLLIVIAVGLAKTLSHHGAPPSLQPIPPPIAGPAVVSIWLLLRSFASGCTALTGVEAVSNGVQSFEEPKKKNAKRTLSVIVFILALLLAGLAILVHAYKITATDPGRAGYQSVLSIVTSAVMGRGIFYYVTIASILMVLSLSANTSFAGFPRVCGMIADDSYLPKAFSLRGRRLVYTGGVVVLGVLAAGVLVMFGGVTDRLIPLFAIGAFLAFTFSQAGMVQHWRRTGGPHSRLYLSINAVGAVATGVTTLLVFVAKFTSGAWITLAVLLSLILLMRGIHHHYEEVAAEIQVDTIAFEQVDEPPLLLLPVARWNRASVTALTFACALRGNVRVLHVQCDSGDEEDMEQWRRMLKQAAERSGVATPELIAVRSDYRAITGPLFQYVLRAEHENPRRSVAVLFPELVAARWYQQALHNYRAMLLKARLFFGGRRRVAIVNIPWQLSKLGDRGGEA
ncbi:MAG TPA: APC family permease [Edaphobacter sp.]|nr:APC family permease [Edaphobacter sp.]